MRKLLFICLVLLLLPGCAATQTFETVTDVYEEPAAVPSYALTLELPEAASVCTMKTQSDILYECEEYSLYVQTMAGGDLDRTLRDITGYESDELSVIQTKAGTFDRYELAWTVAGEGGQQICRTVILDDGNTHHALTAMGDHTKGSQLAQAWQKLFSTVRLVSTD